MARRGARAAFPARQVRGVHSKRGILVQHPAYRPAGVLHAIAGNRIEPAIFSMTSHHSLSRIADIERVADSVVSAVHGANGVIDLVDAIYEVLHLASFVEGKVCDI